MKKSFSPEEKIFSPSIINKNFNKYIYKSIYQLISYYVLLKIKKQNKIYMRIKTTTHIAIMRKKQYKNAHLGDVVLFCMAQY